MHDSKNADFYCKSLPSCMIGCCINCAIKHNDHDFIDINDETLVPKITKEIISYFGLLAKDHEAVKQYTTTLRSNLNDITKDREENVDEIEEYFAELHRKLEIRKTELIEVINEEAEMMTERLTEQLREAEVVYEQHTNLQESFKSFLENFDLASKVEKIESSYQLSTRFRRIKPILQQEPSKWTSYFAHDLSATYEISTIGRIVSRVNELPSQKLVYFVRDYSPKVWKCNLELQTIDEVKSIKIPKFSFFNSVYVDPQDAYYILGFTPEGKRFVKLFEETVTDESTDCPYLNWSCAAWRGNYLYVIGGEKDSCSSDECHKYNLNTKRWEEMPRLMVPRDLAGACGIGGYVMVFGGYTNQLLQATIERFDIKRSRWALLHLRLPVSTASMGLFSTDRGILIFGGENKHGDTKSVFWWDGVGTISECSDLPVKALMDCASMSACYESNLYIIRDEGEAEFCYYTFPMQAL